MIDGRQYLPTVAWSFKVRNVILLTSETTENPATFRCTANPFDSSEPGANTADKEIGYVVVDNVGNLYSVIDTGTYTVDLSDDFRSGVGPQTGKWAVISKTVGDGTAPFLTPIHYRRLDRSAIDNIHRIELDILWRNGTMSKKIEFTNTQTPSILNYQTLYSIYGDLPRFTLITYDSVGVEWERQEVPVRNYVDGLLDSIVWDLSDIYSGYIIISK